MRIIISILMFLMFAAAKGHQPPAYPQRYILLGARHSGAYEIQPIIGLRFVDGRGLSKNKDLNALIFDYAIRIHKDERPEHRFRFLLVEYQGIDYKTLLEYENFGPDSVRGEYLFHHYGLKLLEWDNIKNYYEFMPLTISTDLILENRTYPCRHFNELSDNPEHNFYLSSRLSAGISKVDLEGSVFDVPGKMPGKFFWDMPLGLEVDFGYEWKNERIIERKRKDGEVDYSKRYIINSLNFSIDYKLFPIRNFRVFSYAAEIELNAWYDFTRLRARFERQQIQIDNFTENVYSISIGYPIFMKYF